ncbi:hypothetical protein RU639_003855 [Aspergillus parasiticus]
MGRSARLLNANVQLASCRFYPWLFDYLVKRLPKSAGTLMAQHQAMTQEKEVEGLHGSINRISWPTLYSNNASEKSQHCHPHRPPTPHPADLHYRNPLPSLLNYPTVLSCVTSEVRSVFTSPVPIGLIRLVPTGGHTINGDFFPEGKANHEYRIIVSYMQWAANVSPQNYTDPMDFHLERWLKSPSSPYSSPPSTADRFGGTSDTPFSRSYRARATATARISPAWISSSS